MVNFEASRGGIIGRELLTLGLFSWLSLLSRFAEKELMLPARRCGLSTSAPYLSFRTCSEFALVGLGEGIPEIEIGRARVLNSRTEG
jgi:hypothetical protein